MQIGRKIYYEKTTGKAIYWTEERAGEVVEKTKQEDFKNYPMLKDKIIDDYDFIKISFGEYSELFLSVGSILVNISTKQLTIYPKLKIVTDKETINSDGIDTANIASDYADYFIIDNGNKINGKSFLFSSNVPGKYEIVGYSEKNGTNSIIIEVI
jgi:hypothetical protein